MAKYSDAKGQDSPNASGIAEANQAAATRLDQYKSEALNIPTGTASVINGKPVYLGAPKPLARLLGGPLPAPGGDPFKRRVSQGWGAARTQGRTHVGLDFPAEVGTPVYACYSGRVTFTGVELRGVAGKRSQKIKRPKVDHTKGKAPPDKPYLKGGGNILDESGVLVVDVNSVGEGGMIVFIEHDNAFAGFRTEYMHLSEIVVVNGTYVNEGDLIAYTGNTGGSYAGYNELPHLHFQVRYNGDIVKAEGLVPSTKFTEGNTGFSSAIISYYTQNTPRGQAVVMDNAANAAKSADRSVAAASQPRSELLARGAQAFGTAANVFAGSANLVYQAIGSFLEGGTRIAGPMVFDFETGLWSDDEPV